MNTITRVLSKADLRDANIPSRFWETGIDEVYLPADRLRIIKNYVDNFSAKAKKSQGLLLTGVEQTGKTSLLTVLLKSLMVRGHSARYVRADDLVNLHFNRTNENYGFTYADLLDATVLGLDDVAANGNAGYPVAVGNLLRARYNNQRPTLICVSTRDGAESGEHEIEADYGRELAQFVRNHFVSLGLTYSAAHSSGSGDETLAGD